MHQNLVSLSHHWAFFYWNGGGQASQHVLIVSDINAAEKNEPDSDETEIWTANNKNIVSDSKVEAVKTVSPKAIQVTEKKQAEEQISPVTPQTLITLERKGLGTALTCRVV